MNMSGIMSVEELIQKFKDEWILIEVLEEDELDEPRKVKVIVTSKNRDEIYEKQKEIKGDIAIFYTGKILKEGYALAFNSGLQRDLNWLSKMSA